MNPSLYVSDQTKAAAEALLRKGTGDAAREAVALLLQDTTATKGGGVGGADAGQLLSQGLAEVIRRPHEALGVAVGSSEGEVRRAFRKQALKYHPDKTQGATTQLFQSLTTASQRAVDPSHKPPPAAQHAPKPPTPQQPPPRPAAKPQAAAQPQPSQRPQQADADQAKPKKPHAASGAQGRDSYREYNQYRVSIYEKQCFRRRGSKAHGRLGHVRLAHITPCVCAGVCVRACVVCASWRVV
jgi:hypothetical protein